MSTRARTSTQPRTRIGKLGPAIGCFRSEQELLTQDDDPSGWAVTLGTIEKDLGKPLGMHRCWRYATPTQADDEDTLAQPRLSSGGELDVV